MRSYLKLLAWGILWGLAWIVSCPWRQGRDNCLTWAVKKWQHEGGYLVIRWCRHNTVKWVSWPHFLWLDEKHHHHLEHRLPIEPDSGHFLPAAWFDGQNVVGDPEDVVEN